MRIALDYDRTYDADPEMWDDFIRLAQAMDHEVVLLTYRDDRFDVTPLLERLSETIPVYFTRGVAKKFWSEQFGPGSIDVWIDDKPEAILNNSGLPREGLQTWRREVGSVIGDQTIQPWKRKVDAVAV